MKTRQLKPVITKYLVWGEGFGGILPTQIGEWPFYGKSFLFHKIPVNEKCLTQLYYLSDRPLHYPLPASYCSVASLCQATDWGCWLLFA